MARVPGTRPIEVLDEEFLHHLRRGAELLANGEPAGASSSLERAREFHPDDAQVLGLLGQALYKCGRLDGAIETFERLVEVSPAEAASRVNLGLANLKAGRHLQAIRQFEIALDLSPEHRRAMDYLGLAWLEHGEPARARAWFERAGSTQMVARCDALLAAARDRVEPAGPERGGERLGPAVMPMERAVGDHAFPLVGDRISDDEVETAIRSVDELTPREGDPFATDRGFLTITIRSDVLARSEGLVAIQGSVRLVPQMRRSRGGSTEKPFGDGARRVLQASGDGALVYEAGEKGFVRVVLGDERAYFREDAVFAFEASLAFENGRLSTRSGAAAAMEVVHLHGRGQVLLVPRGEVLALAISGDRPLRVRASALIGWVGAITPQFIVHRSDAPAGEAGDGGAQIELTGTGRALLEGAAG